MATSERGNPSQFAPEGFVADGEDPKDIDWAPPALGYNIKYRLQGSKIMRHVTVKQLYNATVDSDNEWPVIDGQDIAWRTWVTRVQETTRNMILVTINDGTGAVQLRQHLWRDDNRNLVFPSGMQRWQEAGGACYVRVTGGLTTAAGNLALVVVAIQEKTPTRSAVQSHSGRTQVTYHGLRVIFEHLHLTARGKQADARNKAAAREAEHFKACQQPEAPVTPSQPARNGFNRLRQAVNEAMARPQVLCDGMTLDEVQQHLQGRYGKGAVCAAVEWLANEGFIHLRDEESGRYCSATNS